MGKTFSIKVLFGIYLLLMAGKVFAFSCNVDGGSSIGAGTTSVYVNLDPVIQPGQNLVVDLSQHISCWNDYGGWYDTDHINLVQGSAFAGSLQSYKGSLYWNNVTYPFPLTTNTNVLDIGDKTPMPLPLKLYITPVGAAGGVVIKAGEVIARIHMYKIATLGSGNPRNFTWNIISNNSVVMPTGGCTVDSRNVTVNLPDFPGSAEIPLGVYCSSEQKLSFYLSNNDGKTKTHSFNLSFELAEPLHISQVDINPQIVFSYIKSKGNLSLNNGYEESNTGDNRVVYNGNLVSYDSVPVADFNNPLKISLNMDFTHQPSGLVWANTLTWQEARKARIILGKTNAQYISEYSDYKQYVDEKLDSSLTWDTRLSWTPQFLKQQNLTISADILNVLDSKTAVDTTNTGVATYASGRTFWLDVSMKF